MPGNDNIPFDYQGAKSAGYSDQEIQGFLKDKYNFQFDITGAKNSGYSDKEIGDYITNYKPASTQGPIAPKTASDYTGFGSHALDVPDDQETINRKNAVVNESNSIIKSSFNSKHADAAIDKAAQDAFMKDNPLPPQDPNSETQPIPKPVIKLLPSQLKENREAFKETVSPFDDAGKKIIENSRSISKDPDYISNINAAGYAAKRGVNYDEGTYNKIKGGKYGYDFMRDKPTIKLNVAQDFIQGVEDKYNAVNKADDLATKSKEEIIADEENNRDQNLPDAPIPESKGWAYDIGNNAAGFEKMILGGMASAIPGAAPALGPTLGTLFISHDAGKAAAGGTFTEVYHTLRNQGVNQSDAFDTAMNQAKFNGASAAAQMALMSYAGMTSGTKPLFGTTYGKGFKTLMTSLGQNVKPAIGNLMKELPAQAGYAGAFKALENINSGKPIGDDVANSMIGVTKFLGVLHALGAARSSLTPRGIEVGLNGVAGANPELVERGINTLEAQKKLTPEESDKLRKDISNQIDLNKGLKDNTPQENKQKIQDLIAKRTSLENQLDPEHPDFVDKAYHPDIKEQINGVKKEKADGTTEGKDGINEKIRQLSEPVKDDEGALVKSDADMAKGMIEERAVNGKLGGYPTNDPDALLKAIAEQAHGGTTLDDKFVSSRPLTEKAFGKDLVDLATKIHPEHILADEPKSTTGGIPVESEPELRTLDYGDWKGKPESKESQDKIKQEILNNEPIGVSGEKLSDFANRVLPAAKKIMDNPDENTTIVTHSSVIKALNAWDEMGRPDKIDETNRKEFAEKYIAEKPEKEGHLNSFKSDTNGTTTHVIRHGETEDNKLSEFREDNTELTPKGEAQAVKAGQELHKVTGGNIPRINTSDLPRTVATSGIIGKEFENNKTQDNAIPKQAADEVGVRNEAALRPGMGGQDTGPEGSTDNSGPKSGTEEKSKTEGEEKEPDVSGIKNAISRPERGIRKLPEVEFQKMGSDADIINDGKNLVDSGKINPRELVDRINSDPKSTFTPDEAKAMQYYMRQLKTLDTNLRQELASATEESHKIDVRSQLGQVDDEMDAATAANLKGGNDWHQIGEIRQIVIDDGFNPSRQKAAIKDAYGGKVPEDAQLRIDTALKERDAALEDKNKLENELKQKQAELNAEKMKKAADRLQRDTKRAKTKEQLKVEEKDLLDELKKAFKRDIGNAHAGIPIPVGTVEALGKLGINYFRQGINDLGGIIDKIHDNIKDEIDGISKQDIRDLLARYKPLETEAYIKDVTKLEAKAKNLEEKKVGVPQTTPSREKILFQKDTRWVKANQRVVNAEYKIKQEKNKAYNSKQNFVQKTLGWANHLMRLSLLSGKTVLAKLSAQATLGSLASREPESFMNHVWSTVLPKIGEKADIEGYYNAKANGKFYSEFFNGKKLQQSILDIAKTGSSALTKERENQIYEHTPILDLPTDLHTIIKDPPKRAAYEWALEHILTNLEKQGIDINNPLVLEGAKDRAFARAKYEIFLEDNSVSRKFAEWESKWRGEGNNGAMKSFMLHFFFPVSKVPTNIARRVGAYTAGVPMGAFKAREAFSKGIDKLSPDEANQIIRLLSKGSVGWALFGVGLYGAHSAFGGVYNKEVNDKKGKLDVGQLGLNKMKVGDLDVPEAVQHAIPLQLMQLGATYRIIHDHYANAGAGDLESNFKSAIGSTAAVVSNIPVVETPIHLAGAIFNEPNERKRFENDMKRRVEPQILRETGVIPPDKPSPNKRASKSKAIE